jgi:hypothetical protein
MEPLFSATLFTPTSFVGASWREIPSSRITMHENKTSRRKFLKQTISGAVVLAAANLLPAEVLFADELGDVPKDLVYFSPKEYLIFAAAAERLIGPASSGEASVTDVDVAGRADHFLAGVDPEIQDQIHQLLSVFNAPLFTFLFDFRTSSFLNMSPKDKDSFLEDWMTSKFGFRRTGFQALKRISMSMFYTDSRSWKEIGYDGMFMPEDRK